MRVASLATLAVAPLFVAANPIPVADAPATGIPNAQHADISDSKAATPPCDSAAPKLDPRAAAFGLPRLVIYAQSLYRDNTLVSLLPLLESQKVALTHLILAALHINGDGKGAIHLNDHNIDDTMFNDLWQQVDQFRKAGIPIIAMVGGAAPGSFAKDTLDAPDEETFRKYYTPLADAVRKHKLQGLDLDVEQKMSQTGIERLITTLRKDFGPRFIITLTPVATELSSDGTLSGIDYLALEKKLGHEIAWYNAQFYNGWGSMVDTSQFDAMIKHGFKSGRIVAGSLTNPRNGNGYIPPENIHKTFTQLQDKYGTLGGIFGWEYFNSMPGNSSRPWEWAENITSFLRPNFKPVPNPCPIM